MEDKQELSKILNTHFLTLRGLLVNMRQLQRFLVGKEFDACATLTTVIKNDRATLERLERERLQFITLHPLPGVSRAEEVGWQELLSYFLPTEQRRMSLLLSQIKQVTIHIQLLAQSVSRFSNAVGDAMREAFEELVSTPEYTYTEDGNQHVREHCALLYDAKR